MGGVCSMVEEGEVQDPVEGVVLNRERGKIKGILNVEQFRNYFEEFGIGEPRLNVWWEKPPRVPENPRKRKKQFSKQILKSVYFYASENEPREYLRTEHIPKEESYRSKAVLYVLSPNDR